MKLAALPAGLAGRTVLGIGKRVGGTNFMPAGNVWIRGILEEFYGVPHRRIIWRNNLLRKGKPRKFHQ